MNELKLANYALLTVMLITMATFCASVSALTKTNVNITNDASQIKLTNMYY